MYYEVYRDEQTHPSCGTCTHLAPIASSPFPWRREREKEKQERGEGKEEGDIKEEREGGREGEGNAIVIHSARTERCQMTDRDKLKKRLLLKSASSEALQEKGDSTHFLSQAINANFSRRMA